MRGRRLLLLAGTCLLAATCAPRAGGAVTTPAATAAVRQDGIVWMERSAEHDAIFVQTYRVATAAVERHATGRTAGTWAVVLDADETVIDNVVYQIERDRAGLRFTPESWRDWVRRREATPLPGARAFLDRVRALGGRIAIVTNRLGSECEDTIAVFRAQQLVFDAMLCRPDGTPSDKNPRFEDVRSGRAFSGAGAVEIVAWLGDNILDFPGASQAMRAQGDAAFAAVGDRWFVFPNAMYGSWQQ